MPNVAKPTRIKELSGNPSKRKINKREPKPKGGPVRPTVMTSGAKKVWDRLVKSMPEGVYTNADASLLASYCEAVSNHQSATAEICSSDFQMWVTGSTGQAVLNPIFKHQEAQARLIVSLGQRLGLDPIARQQINADDSGKQEDDPFAGLLN